MAVNLESLDLLKKQHAEWDALLIKEESKTHPDDALIQRYKKHKLKVKDEIQKEEEEIFKAP